MNLVDQLQGEMAALSRRVGRCEELLRFASLASVEMSAARVIAEEEEIEREALLDGTMVLQRRALAIALRKRGWSAARIARVYGCCERTAERYVAEVNV